jgi:predicted O-linked N-acetylglucosamine transferase (SPINDLY family)
MIAAFERASALAPENVKIQRGAAAALMRKNELTRSLPLWQKAVSLDPSPANLVELGTNFRLLGDNRAAIETLQKAAANDPGNSTALLELGAALMADEALDEAEDALNLALKHSPRSVPALYNLSSVLLLLGRSAESADALRRLLGVEPNSPDARSRLLVALNYHPGASDADILHEAEEWGRRHGTAPRRLPARASKTKSRPRLGYFAADFGALSPFLPPLVEHHDRQAFELFLYSGAPLPEGLVETAVARGDRFRDVSGYDDDALERVIHEDEIDVLVDLTMHLAGGRLEVLARNPATVQIAWLAYPGTTGVFAMRFRLTDPHLDPPDSALPYTEESIWLREAFWPYAARKSYGPPGELPATRNGFITFGSLNAFSKMHDGVLDAWAKVLAGVEGSKLLVLAPRGRCRERVQTRLARSGVDSDRAEFVDRKPHDEYMDTFRSIDIGLDTFPANGHTTSLDAFYMGVPVVTLAGDRVIGRGGASVARNLDLADLVTANPDAYVETAVRLAKDRARLAALRSSLRDRMERSAFMDGNRFVRHLEGAYRTALSRAEGSP